LAKSFGEKFWRKVLAKSFGEKFWFCLVYLPIDQGHLNAGSRSMNKGEKDVKKRGKRCFQSLFYLEVAIT
jgi:hypothetical protein